MNSVTALKVASASVEKTVEMTLSKSTKGTHVYEAPNGICRAVYLIKSELPDPAPAKITMHVTW